MIWIEGKHPRPEERVKSALEIEISLSEASNERRAKRALAKSLRRKARKARRKKNLN